MNFLKYIQKLTEKNADYEEKEFKKRVKTIEKGIKESIEAYAEMGKHKYGQSYPDYYKKEYSVICETFKELGFDANITRHRIEIEW